MSPDSHYNITTKTPNKQVVKGGSAKSFSPIPTAAAIALRDYQQSIVDAVARATRGSRAILAVLPTGGGKTTVAAELARRMALKGFRVWFLVHRKELLEQAAARFRKWGLRVGIIAAGYVPDPGADVQVAMVQSLQNRLDGITNADHPHFIFVDEAHRATAGQYTAAFEPFPNAVVIGLTATPERADGTGLGETFNLLLNPTTTWDLIRRGFLVQPLYYCAEIELAALTTKGEDYDESSQMERFDKPRLYSEAIQKWRLYGRDYLTVAFCVNVAHSKATAAAFNADGIAAAHLDADTPKREREQILADLAAGKYRVICNVSLLGEGWDLPAVGCVLLNRATKSRPLYFQMVGRAARPTAGFEATTDAERVAAVKTSSKPRAVVIDMGGNLKTHGYWEAPIEYSLEAPKKKKRKKGAPLDVFTLRECPRCRAYTHATARVCPDEDCGYAYPTLIDRAVDAVFVETQFDGSHLLPPPAPVGEPAVKPKPIDRWPEHLRQYYHKPALIPNDSDIDLVEKLAGYKRGWATSVKARKASYAVKKGGRVFM